MAVRLHQRIAVRLSLAIVIVVLVTAAAVATSILRDERHIFQQNLRVRALQLGEIISRQVIEPLLYEEVYTLHELITSYLSSRDALLVYGQIYNEKGEQILSRARPGSHPGTLPRSRLHGARKSFFLRDVIHSSGEEPVDLVVPVVSNRIGVVGYLRLGFTVASLQATLARSRNKVWAVTAVIAFLGSLAGLWMARSLIRPVLLLNQAAQKVGRGELGMDIETGGIGEIRELGRTFNTMSMKLRKLVDEITAAQENLIRTEKLYALGEFSTGLAHEIKNPLTSIKMLIQRSEQEGEPLEGEDLKVIRSEIDRIDDTVSRFLRSARQNQIQRVRTDINHIVEDVAAITRPKIEASNVVLDLDLDREIEPAEIDPAGIRQILLNGILNALQAMPDGGRLTLRTYCNHGEINCAIIDTGTGINDTDLNRVFDPFFTSKEEGTGMGLAVAWNIAQQHDGRLEIDSRPGHGTTLILVLPHDGTPVR
ncbi:MAG TPA: sensor histidine kinase [Desulfobulbus sp.]|nr:sensor histidine kinase [Desulfobulbus sp.]